MTFTPTIYSRADWGAAPPKRDYHLVAAADRQASMAHYAMVQESGTSQGDVPRMLRDIQRFHQGPIRGWNDIAYNWLIDRWGGIWEGRGWAPAGGHCTSMNTPYLGYCFLGNDDPGVVDLTDAAVDAFAWLHQEAERRAGHDLLTLGHQDGPFDNTTCPGAEIMTRVVKRAFAPATSLAAVAEVSRVPRGLLLTLDGINDDGTRRAIQRLVGAEPDGDWGPKTWAAIQRWAGLRGRDVDGIPGPRTDAAVLTKVGRPDLAAKGVRWSHAWTKRPDTVTALVEAYYNRAVRNGWHPKS